ncbi:hypothetical protein ACOBV8_19890 (plasmid) [Pseudoalteromonas espejiana]
MVSIYEQAIVVGGGVNIILAALSDGFMVPLEIMPDNLAALANGRQCIWSAQLMTTDE